MLHWQDSLANLDLPVNEQPASRHTTDLGVDMEILLSPPADVLGFAVLSPLAPPTANRTAIVSHSSTEDRLLPASAEVSRSASFSLRGELMHAFVSYRVETEGAEGRGNGMSGLLAQKVRALSMDEEGLKIPEHGWGIWPKAARKPVPFRKEEAKVFLDRDCLLDGQSWVAGFVQGLHPILTTPNANPEAPNLTPCTLRPEPGALIHESCNLHPATILDPALCTLYPTPCTLHPAS